MKFNAVAFDLDGTLYPNFRLYARLLPFLLKELRLVMALGRSRTAIRNSYKEEECISMDNDGDFYDVQARLMGTMLGQAAGKARERTEQLIYRGWEPIFSKIRLFPHVRETLDAFHRKKVKMAMLSDFPPEAKLKNLDLSGYWDVILCSERTGRLKPDKKPFLDLISMMGLPPENILYVGNSIPYDVEGARNTGMKTALIRPKWKRIPRVREADFVFYDYRQLRDYVLS